MPRTQGLKQYASHRNIRLIYIIGEVGYRIVANKAAGISSLADLKGKRIGYHARHVGGLLCQQATSSAGLGASPDYSVVSGNICMRTPCGSNTFRR